MTRIQAFDQAMMTSRRLELLAPTPALADAVQDFQLRNQKHYAPWDPPRTPDYYLASAVKSRLEAAQSAFELGSAWQFWLCTHDAKTRVLGHVHFSNIVRGVFQSCTLGYALDEAAQGQGLMDEALSAAIAWAFEAPQRLHRIQAAVQSHNARSIRVLARQGFHHEGFSPNYLFLNGRWRDHDVYARINPNWPELESPI